MLFVLLFKFLNVLLVVLLHFSELLLVHLVHFNLFLFQTQIVRVFNKDLFVVKCLKFFNSFKMVHLHLFDVLWVFVFLRSFFLHKCFVSLFQICLLLFITLFRIFKLFWKSVFDFSNWRLKFMLSVFHFVFKLFLFLCPFFHFLSFD